MGASGKGMSDLAGPVVFPFSSINHLRLFPQLASSHFLKFFLDELSSAGLSAQTRLRPRPLARIDGQQDEAEEQGGIPQTAPTTMTTSGSQPLSTAGPTRWALPDVLFGNKVPLRCPLRRRSLRHKSTPQTRVARTMESRALPRSTAGDAGLKGVDLVTRTCILSPHVPFPVVKTPADLASDLDTAHTSSDLYGCAFVLSGLHPSFTSPFSLIPRPSLPLIDYSSVLLPPSLSLLALPSSTCAPFLLHSLPLPVLLFRRSESLTDLSPPQNPEYDAPANAVCAGWIDGEWRRAPTGAEPLDEVSTVLLHSKLEGGEGGPGTGAACLPLPFTCRLQEFRADSAFLERGRVGCETCPPSFRGPRSGATLSSEVAGRKGDGEGDSDSNGFLLASAGAPVVAPTVRLRVPSFADASPSFCVLRQGEVSPAPSSSLLSSSVPANRVLAFVHSWVLKASSALGRGSGALAEEAHEEQTVARAILNVRVLAPRTVEPVHDANFSTRAIMPALRREWKESGRC
ncbi:hypothetical protein B0H13DRAFT_2361875 [Mycena leptocephala]|nr:hypothetical protein B0H13DRAFT_2361875 [Mycena leptocephala]